MPRPYGRRWDLRFSCKEWRVRGLCLRAWNCSWAEVPSPQGKTWSGRLVAVRTELRKMRKTRVGYASDPCRCPVPISARLDCRKARGVRNSRVFRENQGVLARSGGLMSPDEAHFPLILLLHCPVVSDTPRGVLWVPIRHCHG